MLARIPPGALRRRAGYVAIVAVLAGGLYMAGGQAPALAAAQGATSTSPPMAPMLAAAGSDQKVSAPTVDATWKMAHPPAYPLAAIQRGQQGMVVLDVTVGAAGQVTRVRVDPHGTTAPASLQDSAVTAARGWKYTPGHKDGKVVGGVVRIPVNFSLERMDARATPASGAPSVDVSYKNRNPPAYPEQAIKQGQQGTVILDVTVDTLGNVTGIQVDQHGTDAAADLQTAAITAAKRWKFNPGRKGGKPVGGMLQVPVRFSLNDEQANASHANPCPVGDVFDVQVSKCIPDASHFIPPESAH